MSSIFLHASQSTPSSAFEKPFSQDRVSPSRSLQDRDEDQKMVEALAAYFHQAALTQPVSFPRWYT